MNNLQHRLRLVRGAVLCAAAALVIPAMAPHDASADVDPSVKKKLRRLSSGKPNYDPPQGEIYSLEALVERAMESNPQMVARKHAELYARTRRSEAEWARAPVFSNSFAFTVVPKKTDVNQVSSNVEKYLRLEVGPFFTGSIRMVIPIYAFGRIGIARELADLGIDQAELETQKARLKILTQTRQAFYSLQLGKHIQALTKDGLAAIGEEIERQEEAREFGDEDVDIKQLRKLQIYEAELSSQALDNKRLIRLSHAALAALVQIENETIEVPRFNEEIDTSNLLTLEQCLQLAQENRPDVSLLSRAIQARDLQVKLAKTKWYPEIFFGSDFSLGWSTEEAAQQEGFVDNGNGELLPLSVEPFSNPFNFTRFGFLLGARWNINPVNQYFKVEQAELQRAETHEKRRAALQGINLQIEQKWVEVQDNAQKIEIQMRAYRAAERWAKQTGLAFESGGAEFKDFIAPIKEYFKTRLRLLEAQYNFLVSRAQLGELIGVTDIESLSKDASQASEQP